MLYVDAKQHVIAGSNHFLSNQGSDYCRGVCEMRVTAEAAQRFLDQERGMRDALTNALQYVTRPASSLLIENSCCDQQFPPSAGSASIAMNHEPTHVCCLFTESHDIVCC